MYKKEFIPFTDDEIRMINASALAKRFNCTSMWVGKVLKLQEAPTNEKALDIINAARDIVKAYKSHPNKNKS